MAESFVDKQVRLVLEKQCRELADLLKPRVPAGVGFTLFLSDFGSDGNLAYVSTVDRQDSIRMVREWLDTRDPHAKTEENDLLRRDNSAMRAKARRAHDLFSWLMSREDDNARSVDVVGSKLVELRELLEEMAR